ASEAGPSPRKHCDATNLTTGVDFSERFGPSAETDKGVQDGLLHSAPEGHGSRALRTTVICLLLVSPGACTATITGAGAPATGAAGSGSSAGSGDVTGLGMPSGSAGVGAPTGVAGSGVSNAAGIGGVAAACNGATPAAMPAVRIRRLT